MPQPISEISYIVRHSIRHGKSSRFFDRKVQTLSEAIALAATYRDETPHVCIFRQTLERL